MTPAVHAALAHATERTRTLSKMRSRSRLHQFDPWRAFIDDGFAEQPDPRFLAAAEAKLTADESSTTMDQVIHTIALTEQHIHELSDRRPTARAARIRKRVAKLARRIRSRRLAQQSD